MNKADEIHFNENGFDFGRFGGYVKNVAPKEVLPGTPNTTNYELQQILTNQTWLNKTTFH